MASSTAEKVRENRLRRVAARRGLQLIKSRRRDPRALDFGLYVLVDHADAAATAFTDGRGVDLDGIEEQLA